MTQQTRKQYIEQALLVICQVLSQDGQNLLQATVDQALHAFQGYVQTQPMSLLTYNYYYYGSSFQRDLPLMWPAFQYELARSFDLI